jgi:2',3'-cyclic-nucleotide 2'-phosphodiesterase (5'-nucleotidase family)
LEPIRISIFHTNDMHGRLEPMARLSSFAQRLRAEAEAERRSVFFWDAGDAEDRRIKICSISKGAAFQPIMSAMGYTLATMGNSISLTYGPQAMTPVTARADFPILAANCRDGDGPLVEGLRSHVIVPLPGGFRMGVIGLTTPWGNFYDLFFGLRFPDYAGVARELVGELRGQGVELVVVLSHLGSDDDRRLAEAVPGIDLIIGGHFHERFTGGEEVNGVLIAQAGEYAEALGRVDLSLDARTGEVLHRSACVLEVPDDEPPDPLVMEAIGIAEQEIAELMARPVGELQGRLDMDHFGECGVGNLAADVLRKRMSAEAAMVAAGQFRQELPAGVVTLGDLDTTSFSTANPGVTEVSGAQILEALERGLDPAIAEHLHHGYRGAPIGIPQISGMVVTYDPGGKVGQRVRIALVQGQPLDPDRTYRLAHTDAECMREHGYLVLEDGQEPEYEVPTILREAMEDYLQQHSPVPVPRSGRWVRQKEDEQ